MSRMAARALAAALALAACGGARGSRPGPTHYHPAPVPPAAYAHYIRGRVAVYERDYAEAVREFRRARRAAPAEPALLAALAQAELLYLAAE